ncbi:hypothetical protein KR084_006217, partial [Drosophila pseudotakahashii]
LEPEISESTTPSHYEQDSPRKIEIDNAVMNLIVSDMQPFRIVEETGFKKLVSILNPKYKLPSRTALQNVCLMTSYEKCKERLQNLLKCVNYCSITSDGWTSRANVNYLTVTCHFILKDKLRSAVLFTCPLINDTNHSGQNIADSINKVLDEWNIREKVVAVVTDNAQSMKKACTILQKFNLPCFAHTLNLVMQDVLKHYSLKDIIIKCKKLVGFFKSSSIAYAKFRSAQLRNPPLSLIQEVATRWNSAYKMINRILLTKDSISTVLLSTRKSPEPLNAEEIEFLEDIEDLFSQVDDATKKISANDSVTISLILPLTCGLLKNIMESCQNMKTVEGTFIGEYLLERLVHRLKSYEEMPLLKKATLLDPRFKKEGFKSLSIADEAAAELKREVELIEKGTLEVSSSNLSSPQSPSLLGKRDIFGFLKSAVLKKSIQVEEGHILEQYFRQINISTAKNPIQYWEMSESKYKTLKCYARKYLHIPATSTESERMFSKAGYIASDRRSALKPRNINMLLFLNKNQ